MISDLRFVIGAVIATALLGVTVFGLAAAMHISHQSKIGPLEASRLLAYTPEGRHRVDISARRSDSPFANMPADPNPVPLRQQSSEPAAPPVQTAANAKPESAAPSATDADTVDERAVVDPPLPLDNDAPAAGSAPAAASPESAATATPDVEQVGSIPTVTDATETRSDVPTIAETREPPKAKAKRAARKAVAKAKRPVRRAPAPVEPFSSTGYQVGTASTANRPAKGFWLID